MRKAQVSMDAVIIIILILFLLSFLGLMATKFFNVFNDNIQSSGLENEAKNASDRTADRLPTYLDTGFLFGAGLLAVLLFISSSLIGTNPVWFFVNVLAIILLIGGAALFSNLFAYTNVSALATERAAMQGTVFIMDNLLGVVIGYVAVGLIGYFAKPFGQ